MIIRKLLNYWFRKKRSGFYVFFGLAAAGTYLVGASLPASRALSATLKQAGFGAFLAVSLAFFIQRNLWAAHWFLEHFKDTDHLPRKQISLVNSFSMTVFLTLALVALPALAYCLEPLWQAIGSWFLHRINLDKAVYPALHMDTEPVQAPDLTALLGEPKPTPFWILFLDKILRIAGTVVIGFLMVLALWRLLLRVWAWIMKPRRFDSDEKIYLTPTWSLPSPGSTLKKRLKKGKGSPRSFDRKIRQMYRREILSRYRKIKRSPSLSASPAELEQAAGLMHPTLHELYEKARYSQNGCDRQDWENLAKGERSAPTPEV